MLKFCLRRNRKGVFEDLSEARFVEIKTVKTQCCGKETQIFRLCRILRKDTFI